MNNTIEQWIKDIQKQEEMKKIKQDTITQFDNKLRKHRETAKNVPQDVIEKARITEKEAIKKDIAMRVEEMQAKAKQDLLRKKHDEIIKNETQITHASDLENLRIVAEAEKFYQEMMSANPLSKCADSIEYNRKNPDIDRALLQESITEAIFS